jgi:hypothetical protein
MLANELGSHRDLQSTHAVCGRLRICVGFHRLLTHRSFKCSKPVEYALALPWSLGTHFSGRAATPENSIPARNSSVR